MKNLHPSPEQPALPNWITEIVERERRSKIDWGDSDLGFNFYEIDLWIQRGAEILSYSFEEIGLNPVSIAAWIQLRITATGLIDDDEFLNRVEKISGTNPTQEFLKSIGVDSPPCVATTEEEIKIVAQKIHLELLLDQSLDVDPT